MIPILLGTGLGGYVGDLRAQAAGIGGFSTMQVPRVQTGGSHRSRKFFLRPAKNFFEYPYMYMRKKRPIKAHQSQPLKDHTIPCRTESTLKRSTNPCTVLKEKRRKKRERKKKNVKVTGKIL